MQNGLIMTEGNTTPINQCDGCLQGLPLIDGIHKGEGRDMMSCTKDKYTPIEKKEEPREDIVAYVEKGEAIDFTPIYTIRFHKTVKAGDVLIFDAANKHITREAKNYYAKRK